MKKKYKLTEETINVNGKSLYRIKALKDFSDVKKGDKGGFIENEDNLSQSDDCWIYDNAKVYGDAMVFDNAKVHTNAEVFDNAKVHTNAEVFGNANIYGDANVFDNSIVFDNVAVYGDACVYDNAKVYNNANIYGNAKVYENTVVCGNAKVFDYASVFGKAEVGGNALIKDMSDYIVFKNWWSSGRYFTWTKSNNMWKVGCFYGTGKELIEKAYKDSELSGREYKRVVDYVESMLKEMLNNLLIKEQNIRKDNGFENIEKE